MKRISLIILCAVVGVRAACADEPIGAGTAFFVNEQGWAVTNAHVVQNCTRVTTSDGLTASEVRLDAGNDLAAIRLDQDVEKYVEFRRTGARLGEDIAAFGYPLGSILSSSVKVTTGNVNSLMGLADDTRYLQISTPIQPGNSGGPVVDRSGHLVGVTTATLKPEAGAGALPQNVNFALRSSLVETFLESRGIEFNQADAQAASLDTADMVDAVKSAVFSVTCYGSTSGENAQSAASQSNVPERPKARTFSVLDGYDVVGFDYATLKGVSRRECERACNDDLKCEATTYNKKERFCFLKDDAKLLVQNADAFASVADSVKADTIISSFVIGASRDIPGGDYKQVKTDFVGCYVACEIDQQCRAFSFVRKKRACWLKSSVGTVVSKSGVDSGIK